MQKREEGPRPTSTSTLRAVLRIADSNRGATKTARRAQAERNLEKSTVHTAAMASTSAPWQWPIPRPLQQLFDHFPLVTYSATELPARSWSATSNDLPTLYVFATEDDARLGAPSFNPGCLKWQA